MNDMSRAVRGMEAATVADWARSAGDRAAAPWLRWTGPILSIAIIFVVARFLGRADLIALGQLLPVSPGFWVGMALLLSIQPIADYIIFRGLWPLPLIGGLTALLRKSASNEFTSTASANRSRCCILAAVPAGPYTVSNRSGDPRQLAVERALQDQPVAVGLCPLRPVQRGRLAISERRQRRPCRRRHFRDPEIAGVGL